MSLATESELQAAYSGKDTARRYVGDRFTTELNRLVHDRHVALVNELIAKTRARRVVEIASGPGRVTGAVQLSGRVVCLEYNVDMIEEGRRTCDAKGYWVCGNAFQLPFGKCFDLAYCFRFVRHLRLKDRHRLYGEIRRILKPDGYFIMDAVNERFAGPLRQSHPEDYPIYDKLFTREELCTELIDAGFEPLALLPVQKFYRRQWLSQVLLGPRVYWLNRLLIRGLERVPRRDGMEWAVTCRRA